MSKKELTREEIVDISNKMSTVLAKELSDDEQAINPADFICVLGIMHRTLFANIEAKAGIEKAREKTGFLIELVEMTMESGAWDEENKCIR